MWALLLIGCFPQFQNRSMPDDPTQDYDGDGLTEIEGDCDDRDPGNSLERPWYSDSDGDGFGDAAVTKNACFKPDFFVDNPLDCNDSLGEVNPDALEICDQLDNNCSGQVDEGIGNNAPVDAPTWYADSDRDG